MSNKAYRFILLFGLLSLLADMTYEGGRSITGPFLAYLGASSIVVGAVSGFGEFVNYGLRSIFGYLADKTQRYWFLTISGYIINLLAIPMLAFVNKWEWAVALLTLERLGKALRAPSKEAIFSSGVASLGYGKSFGLHEAMDQIGAILGPVLVAILYLKKNSYHDVFLYLFIPALLAVGVLLSIKTFFPIKIDGTITKKKKYIKSLSVSFWTYCFALGLFAIGFVDFPLIAYHLRKNSILTPHTIALYYSIAMGIDALSALVLGRLYDKKGMIVLPFVFFVSCWFAPFAFSKAPIFVAIGMVLWGIGMGTLESVVKAVIAEITPSYQRATAFGMFNGIFGILWLMGSLAAGIMYHYNIGLLILFSIISQMLGIIALSSIKLKNSEDES